MMKDYYEAINRWVIQHFGATAGDFDRGFYTALALVIAGVLLLLVLWLIVRIIFRKPALDGVTIEHNDGDIFISRGAITGIIRHQEKKFPEFEVIKSVLKREKHQLVIVLTVNFSPSAGTLPERAEMLKQRIFSDLATMFGITNLDRIELCLHKMREDSDTSGTSGEAGDPESKIDGTYVAGF